MKRAVEMRFGELPSYRHLHEAYDPEKLGLGRLMTQKTGLASHQRFVGPNPISIERPMEANSNNASAFPWAMRWTDAVDNQIDWIFAASCASAATTRRVMAWSYNRLTGEFAYKGYVLLTMPLTGNQTVRGLRVAYDKYSKGTCQVVAGSGFSNVTALDAAFTSDGIPDGCRIGFGSSNPSEITAWYPISGANTLSETVRQISVELNLPAGTPYVIEDLRLILATTNATSGNGGLHIAKGISWDDFVPGGTTILVPTADNYKGVYFLKDAATQTNTASNGLGLEDRVDWQTQYVWVGNGTTSQRLFKYNIRAALTLSPSGVSTSAYVLKTNTYTSIGTASQNNNGRLATTASGPGAGQLCYYYTSASRIMRSKPVSAIVDNDSSWVADDMTPVPPGGVSTHAQDLGMQALEYSGQVDAFVVVNFPSNVPSARQMLVKYAPGSTMVERYFGVDLRQNLSSSADSDSPVGLQAGRWTANAWIEDSLCYWLTQSTTSESNYMLAIPLMTDWEYTAATGAYIITPAIDLPDCDRISRVLVQEAQVIGGTTGNNLGVTTEPFRIFYRTSGIADNTGAWIPVSDAGGVDASGAPQIQFKMEFKALGVTCIPTRVYSLAVIYEDTNADDRYQFSATLSSAAFKRFAWRHSTAFGGSVPALRVRLYDAVTGNLLVDDNTDAPAGTWERSTDDGVSWSAFTDADKSNELTYVRYTPASIADNVKVRASLTLA